MNCRSFVSANWNRTHTEMSPIDGAMGEPEVLNSGKVMVNRQRGTLPEPYQGNSSFPFAEFGFQGIEVAVLAYIFVLLRNR